MASGEEEAVVVDTLLSGARAGSNTATVVACWELRFVAAGAGLWPIARQNASAGPGRTATARPAAASKQGEVVGGASELGEGICFSHLSPLV